MMEEDAVRHTAARLAVLTRVPTHEPAHGAPKVAIWTVDGTVPAVPMNHVTSAADLPAGVAAADGVEYTPHTY